ncbi:MAG: hypothetical protein DMG93_21035 [Acidobacteria bacterium]|nr:MAG: hypothetical protein DMG93_21035 [Acidobacteriota bacterium]
MGTVIALARSKGHVDIDPLAVLISRVWTTSADTTEAQLKAREVLVRARKIFSGLPQRDAYPVGSDRHTKRFVAYWFDGYARRQLTALSIAIARVRSRAVRDILFCALSRLIISKQSGVSLAMDLSHSRPHKVFKRAPQKPFRKFLSAVDRVAANCVDKRAFHRGPAPRIHLGDARSLPVLDASIDLVLTSPPYLNAIDYIRASKFSLVWMGYRMSMLRELRSDSVGTERLKDSLAADSVAKAVLSTLKLDSALSTRDRGILARYIDDMHSSIKEVSRVLAPKGEAVYIIGENTFRGTYIPNAEIIRLLAAMCSLSLQKRSQRTLPANRRYLPPPSKIGVPASMDVRMRREVILSFAKL